MPIIVTTEKLARQQETDEELKKLFQDGTHSLQLRKLRLDNTDTSIYCDISAEEVRPMCPKLYENKYSIQHTDYLIQVHVRPNI